MSKLSVAVLERGPFCNVELNDNTSDDTLVSSNYERSNVFAKTKGLQQPTLEQSASEGTTTSNPSEEGSPEDDCDSHQGLKSQTDSDLNNLDEQEQPTSKDKGVATAWCFSTDAPSIPNSVTTDLSFESQVGHYEEPMSHPPHKQIEMEDEVHFKQLQLHQQQQLQKLKLVEHRKLLAEQRKQLRKQQEELKQQQRRVHLQQDFHKQKMQQSRRLQPQDATSGGSDIQFQSMPLMFSTMTGSMAVSMLPVTAVFPTLNTQTVMLPFQGSPPTLLSLRSPFVEGEMAGQPPPGNWGQDIRHGKKAQSFKSSGPVFGNLHRFHPKASLTGLSLDFRTFTKRQSKGRLSIISENQIRYSGVHRYTLQFTAGELSNADGVGFIFSTDLPCPQNIQKIVSVFANRTGRICIRAHSEVERIDASVKSLEIGDWMEVMTNLDNRTVSFSVWPADGGHVSSATVDFGPTLELVRRSVPNIPRNPCGYLAAVVKHVGVSVTLAS